MTFQRKARALKSAAAIGALIALAGCQASPASVIVTQNPHTLIYSYLIAHGMARGSVMSGAISPDALPTLVLEDRTALLAVMTATAEPSSTHIRAAGHEIENLLALVEPKDLPSPVIKGADRQAR